MDMPGFDPGTFRMLSGRDTNFATRPENQASMGIEPMTSTLLGWRSAAKL